jgi:hypothetical protein
MPPLDLTALHGRLLGLEALSGLAPGDIEPLPGSGLAHDHLRLGGTGLLLRVPKQSQLALGAAANLSYQAACFRRSAPSGHVPRLVAELPPAPDLPMGALVVEEIRGRPPELPRDMPAIALALAAIHALPVPAPAARPPLRDHADPVGQTLAEVLAQAAHLPEAGLAPDALREIRDELDWAHDFARRPDRPPVTLISFDAHPGNFLVEPSGRAVLVDLEKGRYGAPGFDLAHATLYTSTTWDVATSAALSPAEVADLHRAWLGRVPPALAEASRPWLLPLRRVMWLWSATWCAKWLVLSRRRALAAKHEADRAEDWSSELSDPALVAHVAERVAHYLDPRTIRRVRADWLGRHALTSLLDP